MANQTIRYFFVMIQNSKELSEKEKDILSRRLKGNKLHQISRKHKRSLERIRQVEKQALNKLHKKIIQLRLLG